MPGSAVTVQGLEGILDESDDEDEAENITEVDAKHDAKPGSELIRSFGADHEHGRQSNELPMRGCDWHCWRQEDRKQSQKTEEGQKSNLAKEWPF